MTAIKEPFTDIGMLLVEKICNATCVPAFEHVKWDDMCKEFALSFQFDPSIIARGDLLVVTPFTESEAITGSDDCNCMWDIGFQILVFAKLGKDLESKLKLSGNNKRLRELMALRNWLKRLMCSHDFCSMNGFSQVFNEPGEIIDDDQACEGIFSTQLTVGYRECESRDWCDDTDNSENCSQPLTA